MTLWKVTFCKLNGLENPSEESYKHILNLECTASRSALDPIANKNNIKIPDGENEGEKIIYFFPQEGKWNEIWTNIFYLIYKAYINATRLRKAIPNHEAFDKYVKNETIKIAKANPSNNDLIENMIPLWTGREISASDIVKLLEEYEGNDGKS